jgi:predicted DNA binding CopG/RHH family protein
MATRQSRRPATTGKESKIPEFKTVQEAAEFFDTHSLAEFEDEFEDAPDVVFVKAGPKKTVSVRLDEASMARVTKEAQAKGIGPSTLIRMWVLERLRSLP